MRPLLSLKPPIIYRINISQFGIEPNKDFSVISIAPSKGKIVVVQEHGQERETLAMFIGPRHVQLPNGSLTWCYDLIGVVV